VAYKHADVDGLTGEEAVAIASDGGNKPVVNEGPKLGRNDPCWCGSGKKYKHCHGRLD
jgi:preprotein translocase subunit SecA